MSDDASPDSGAFVRESGRLSLLTLVSRVLGLVREMTRAAFMGTGVLADAFTVSFLIPNFLRRLFAEGSIAVAFIPTFKGYLLAGDREESEEFLCSMHTVLNLLVGGTVLLGIALTPLIVRLFRSDPAETVVLTRMMFPYLALVSFAAFLQGILNSVHVFVPAGVAPILFNLGFIAVPYLIAPFLPNPARALAVGVLVGGLAQALCQLPAVLRRGYRFRFISPARAFRNPGMRRVLALIAPTILGMAAYQVNELVCTAVASRAGVGVATSLTFSLRLQELVLGIFAVSIGTVMLPDLSERAKLGDWGAFSDRLEGALKAIVLVTIPVAVFSMIEGRDIIVLLFKAREFGEESVNLTVRAFFFHMTGLFFIASNRILAPAFYAQEDTKSPVWAGMAAFAVNILLAVLLAGPMGGGGIALALSLGSALNTLILVRLLIRRGVPGVSRAAASVARYALRILAFSVPAGAAAYLCRRVLTAPLSGTRGRFLAAGVPLAACTLAFAAVGVGLLALTRDEPAAGLLRALGRRNRR
ncbi:MAG: murein biosynthesis integral membrane protein MurJ [Treponema sp.]|nr:murein biosynthesis integral membrane protein MurJ [Treponema sp.]